MTANPILTPNADPLRELAAALNRHAARGEEPDLELGGIAGALVGCAADVDRHYARLAERARAEHAEALRLDRTRPTSWAYEQAGKALETQRQRADTARTAAFAEAATAVMARVEACDVEQARIGLGVAHYLLCNMPAAKEN